MQCDVLFQQYCCTNWTSNGIRACTGDLCSSFDEKGIILLLDYNHYTIFRPYMYGFVQARQTLFAVEGVNKNQQAKTTECSKQYVDLKLTSVNAVLRYLGTNILANASSGSHWICLHQISNLQRSDIRFDSIRFDSIVEGVVRSVQRRPQYR